MPPIDIEKEEWENMIYLGVQGERLRVSHRVQAGLPLNERDANIAACGVGTVGEHYEAGRRTWLKMIDPARRQDAIDEVNKRLLNEGGDKP